MPPEVVAQGKRCLIDGFGVILAGSTTQGSAIVREYVTAAAGRREATVLGSKQLMTSAAYAALANGASGHAMDYDDTQLSTTPDRTYGLLTHPTLPPLVAALAVGERAGASGAAFLEAFLTGFEVECKIAEAIDPGSLHPRLPQLGYGRRLWRRRRGRQAAQAERPADHGTC